MAKLKSLYATPEAVEQAFYDALEAGDVAALMNVWSDEDEIVCVHPGGPRLVGARAIAASWGEILSNGPISVRPSDPHVLQGSLVSVHSARSRVMALVRTEGTPAGTPQATHAMAVNILVTHVFFKGALGWRLVLHHASVTPEDADSNTAPPAETLH